MKLFKKKAKSGAAATKAADPKSFVIIKNAPKGDYMQDFAALPITVLGQKKSNFHG